MNIPKENFEDLVNYIKNELKQEKWDYITCEVFFHEKGSYGNSVKYFFEEKVFDYATNAFEVIPILRKIFSNIINGSQKGDFNKAIITIYDDDYSVVYKMDEEKVIDDKQKSALVFPNFLYEKMRSQIYEYELNNNLLTPIHDDDGKIYDYEESWDSGLFTFILDLKNRTIEHTIELFKDGIKRVIPIKLSDFLIEEIFAHHEITHGALKENWQPWNKIELTAPKNFIPLGKDQEYIKYSIRNFFDEL